jgi:hypothetical protein
VVSSLAPEHVINLTTSILDQAIERSTFTDRTPPLDPSLHASSSLDLLHATLNLQSSDHLLPDVVLD